MTDTKKSDTEVNNLLAEKMKDLFDQMDNLTNGEVKHMFDALHSFTSSLKEIPFIPDAVTKLLDQLEQPTDEYLTYFMKQLEMHGYFTEGSLKLIHDRVVINLTEPLSFPERFDSIVTMYFGLLLKTVSKCNSRIVESQIKIADQLIKKTTTIFENKLQLFILERKPNQNNLVKFALVLMTQYILEFKEVLDLTDTKLCNFPKMQEKVDILSKQLKFKSQEFMDRIKSVKNRIKTGESKKGFSIPVLILCILRFYDISPDLKFTFDVQYASSYNPTINNSNTLLFQYDKLCQALQQASGMTNETKIVNKAYTDEIQNQLRKTPLTGRISPGSSNWSQNSGNIQGLREYNDKKPDYTGQHEWIITAAICKLVQNIGRSIEKSTFKTKSDGTKQVTQVNNQALLKEKASNSLQQDTLDQSTAFETRETKISWEGTWEWFLKDGPGFEHYF